MHWSSKERVGWSERFGLGSGLWEEEEEEGWGRKRNVFGRRVAMSMTKKSYARPGLGRAEVEVHVDKGILGINEKEQQYD